MIYIVPVVIFVALWFIPESPRWLILQGRYEDGLKSLNWLRPDGADIDAELAEIRQAIDIEKTLASGVGMLDMFKNPVDRRRTMISVCAVLLQAASGSMFIIGRLRLKAGPMHVLTMTRQLSKPTSLPWHKSKIHLP
jgi:hypothetical protein